ncbi:hypothetical protein, partial [Acidaminococcus fermentans]|uniref:hypothetical protein n=2 Tax=Acidaminococcus fermentans TaxID=905 RepID=UPI0039F4B11C
AFFSGGVKNAPPVRQMARKRINHGSAQTHLPGYFPLAAPSEPCSIGGSFPGASPSAADDFLCSLFTCPDAGYRPPVPLWLHIRQQQQHMFRIPMISSPHFQICNSYDFNMHFSA